MAYQLICLAGPLQGQIFDLKDSLSVGRHPSNDLAISQLSVSRRHCTLTLESDGFRLRDAGSLFGTFVNEQAIKTRLLRHGDVINVGESLFLFQHPDPPLRQPTHGLAHRSRGSRHRLEHARSQIIDRRRSSRRPAPRIKKPVKMKAKTYAPPQRAP